MTHIDATVPSVQRRRRGPKPHQPFDKRTLIGRRAVALAATYRARLGAAAADPVVTAAIDKAARLTALAEDAAARALRADPRVSLDDVVRLTHWPTFQCVGSTLTIATRRSNRSCPITWPHMVGHMMATPANRDASRTLRAAKLFELTRLQGLHWADPSDADLLERIVAAQGRAGRARPWGRVMTPAIPISEALVDRNLLGAALGDIGELADVAHDTEGGVCRGAH